VAFLARMQAIAVQTRCSYGSRRMAKQLQADGLAVGRDTARRLRHQAEVVVQRRKKRPPVPTDSRPRYGIAPHVLARAFDVEQPTQVWVGDLPAVWTAEGWLSVAVLLDLYSRTVVGWARSPHVDAALVQAA
jgi:putative transposase